jgi:hypothetical protein
MSKRILAVVIAVLAVAAVPALAATKNGITPIYPKPGVTVSKDKVLTLKAKVTTPGDIWFYVCRSPKRDKDGLICDGWPKRGKRVAKNRYEARMGLYRSLGLYRPGTYYWQAHRIACVNGPGDCAQEGPVVKFKLG